MKTRVKWVEGASFVGESGSGHAIVIDGAPEHGGRNLGFRPMEVLLTGAVVWLCQSPACWGLFLLV